jgi:alpha-galactosidase
MDKRIVLIGAGSAQFGLGTLSEIFYTPELAGSKVVLHDIDAAALERVAAEARSHVAAHHLPYTVEATTVRREALQGADYCIISIEVGNRFTLWEQDWHVPLSYGIRQVYGENGGPGGLFHALRIVPPILAICEDIQAVCPAAHVFNFSNPMSRICQTVTRKFPQLKFVGLCHEVASLPRHLPVILDTPWENLDVTAGGLNHFSVVLKATYRDSGRDAYPDILAKAPAYFEARVEHQPADQMRTDYYTHEWPDRGLFRVMMEQYGLMPITTDSHFGEYISWAHDVVDHRGILDFYNWYKVWSRAHTPAIDPGAVGERVIPIIAAIATGERDEEMAVNLPNHGLIENLPPDLVVEVPAVVDGDGVHGVPLGTLPRGYAGLLMHQAPVLDLTAEAILTGSRQAVLQALLADPVVHSLRAAQQTLDTILDMQHEYLGYIH